MKAHFDSVPLALEQAAWVDGYSRVGTFWRIVLPGTRAAILAVVVVAFLNAWNDYVVAATMVTAPAQRTAQVALIWYQGTFGREWGPLMAGVVVATIPPVVRLPSHSEESRERRGVRWHQGLMSMRTRVPRRAVPVVLSDVSKRYGTVAALEMTSLSIEAGEFVSLLGPSGCGKSTTLNLIAGLEEPSSGSIRIGDLDVTRLPPQRRNVAMVFQNYALYPHLTAFDNIAFPLRLKRRHLGPDEIRGLVERTAGALGISALLGRRPGELSGGQRQRVALGRALVRQPSVFLLDEPLSNLDNQLRVEMRSELKELHDRVGATMVYVTHDQAEAIDLVRPCRGHARRRRAAGRKAARPVSRPGQRLRGRVPGREGHESRSRI